MVKANTPTSIGPHARTGLQGPTWATDRLPRTAAKVDPNAGSATIVHTRLHGAVTCTAFGIGPVSLRLSNLTLIMADRRATHALVQMHLWFTDRVALAHLGTATPQQRTNKTTPLGQVLTLVELTHGNTTGTTKASASRPGKPETSIAIGPVRITACDHDAAANIATAAAEAYEVARHTYTGLRTMTHHIEAHTKIRMVGASTT